MANKSIYGIPRDCGDCPIRHRAVCARCETDELAQLEKIKYYRSFKAGQTVIWAGDRMDFVGSVVTGVATLNQTRKDGRTQMIGLLLPSDFIGRPGRTTAAYDVVANTDIVMCCFRRRSFEELLESTPHVADRYLKMSLDDLDAAREWMMVLGRKTAREKVASLLAVTARRDTTLRLGKGLGPTSFDLPLSREAMANYLGLTLETVSRQFTALRKDGVIMLENNRHVTVPDFEQLIDEAGDAGGDDMWA